MDFELTETDMNYKRLAQGPVLISWYMLHRGNLTNNPLKPEPLFKPYGQLPLKK